MTQEERHSVSTAYRIGKVDFRILGISVIHSIFTRKFIVPKRKQSFVFFFRFIHVLEHVILSAFQKIFVFCNINHSTQ